MTRHKKSSAPDARSGAPPASSGGELNAETRDDATIPSAA